MRDFVSTTWEKRRENRHSDNRHVSWLDFWANFVLIPNKIRSITIGSNFEVTVRMFTSMDITFIMKTADNEEYNNDLIAENKNSRLVILIYPILRLENHFNLVLRVLLDFSGYSFIRSSTLLGRWFVITPNGCSFRYDIFLF